MILRFKYGYDGVICTDWGITDRTCWGTESLSVIQRHFKVIMAGVDQFGGNNASGPVIKAYKLGVQAYGEAFMRKRFEQSAVRLLMNMFHTGLFENPYVDIERTVKIVGNPEFMKKGYEAQLKSIVLLKNNNGVLPLKKGAAVYIPRRHKPAGMSFLGIPQPESYDYPVNIKVVKNYFKVTDDDSQADFAIVFVKGPDFNHFMNAGYSDDDVKAGGNGYVPQNLQYRPYKAITAREVSIAGSHPTENFTNRSYWGKTTKTENESDLDLILATRKAMGNKPVVVVMHLSNPAVINEFESEINALLVHFGVQDQAVMDILSGAAEPSGLLPLQMPANMRTVEEQFEDVPFDMECHTDSEGNTYNYAFGLNWHGVIVDARTRKYRRS